MEKFLRILFKTPLKRMLSLFKLTTEQTDCIFWHGDIKNMFLVTEKWLKKKLLRHSDQIIFNQ